jgi:hypothetical protein
MSKDTPTCEGSRCPIREQCACYREPDHWPALPADYSKSPNFKPPVAKESCTAYVEFKEKAA